MVKYKVTASSLNIRSSAEITGSNIIGSASKGTILEIQSDTLYNKTWLKLDKPYNGKSPVYASSQYLEKIINTSIKNTDGIIENFSSNGKIDSLCLIYSTDGFTYKNSKDEVINASTGKTLAKGSQITITKKSSNGFYYITDSNQANKSGWVPMVLVILNNGETNSKVDKNSIEYSLAAEDAKSYKKQLESASLIDVSVADYGDSGIAKKVLLDNLNGIHGAPYQFMSPVDSRFDSKTYIGRKYSEKIIAKMPLLLMTPGSPDFLPNFSTDERNSIVGAMVSKSGLKSGSNLNKILKTTGRYYTFKFNYADYYGYVNSMLRMCAVYLGIQGIQIGKDKLGSYKWQNAVNKNIKGFINSQEYVAFYLDSETSISESFSTQTTESALGASINSASSMAKELQFLAGPIAGVQVDALDATNYEATLKDIEDISSKHLNNSRLFNNLAEQFTTVGKGGKIAFPEIWDDTEFSKSYSISIKLRTPDGDKLSWYLNICVPLIHLLAMAAPQQMGPNGYKSPFLVRAYYKGLFNCDMGIITNMDITKGKEGAWTIDGLPTEVDVNITLKDLYSLLSITNADKTPVKNFLNNTCLMDYLANTCGININKPEIDRVLETYVLLTKNKMKDVYANQWLKLQNGLSNLSATAYKKFSGNTN